MSAYTASSAKSVFVSISPTIFTGGNAFSKLTIFSLIIRESSAFISSFNSFLSARLLTVPTPALDEIIPLTANVVANNMIINIITL